ncbi:protein-S-isoprenylcysteine O-methyltransferase B-like isoform X2 [Impatiens glandulifera]|nr:protein-S-isoprenylcysteine O-methyltransferase B-like isoform X2 [Impatiens glandulifera]
MPFLKNYQWPLLVYASVLEMWRLTVSSEILSDTAAIQLSQMFGAIFFFHISEYILAVKIHGRSNVTLSSLLISKQYLMAMLFSLVEYFLELSFLPGLKDNWWISYLGLVMVIIGEIIRKLAILTAGRSFTHLIRVQHDRRHEFITHGIYSFVRHPGYSGFLVWSVGTQVMMCSPISTLAFAVVVWNFFAKRIPYEEHFLRQFFGQEYVEYADTVPSGIPFVK